MFELHIKLRSIFNLYLRNNFLSRDLQCIPIPQMFEPRRFPFTFRGRNNTPFQKYPHRPWKFPRSMGVAITVDRSAAQFRRDIIRKRSSCLSLREPGIARRIKGLIVVAGVTLPSADTRFLYGCLGFYRRPSASLSWSDVVCKRSKLISAAMAERRYSRCNEHRGSVKRNPSTCYLGCSECNS